jgi:hypothetical protein
MRSTLRRILPSEESCDEDGGEELALLHRVVERVVRVPCTLNHEHHRLQVRQAEGEVLRRKKADRARKNHKLQVSRMATGFSMVASLASAPVPVAAEAVRALCLLTPHERCAALRERGCGAELVRRMDDGYDRFLASTRCTDDELAERCAQEAESGAAMEHAREYGDLIDALLQDIVPTARFRYLVV